MVEKEEHHFKVWQEKKNSWGPAVSRVHIFVTFQLSWADERRHVRIRGRRAGSQNLLWVKQTWTPATWWPLSWVEKKNRISGPVSVGLHQTSDYRLSHRDYSPLGRQHRRTWLIWLPITRTEVQFGKKKRAAHPPRKDKMTVKLTHYLWTLTGRTHAHTHTHTHTLTGR